MGPAYVWRDGSELTLIDTGTADRAEELEAEVVGHRLEAPVIRGEAAGAPAVLEEFEIPIRLHLPGPGVVFTGDAVANVSRTMLGAFNTDRARAVESLGRLALLDVPVAVFGHGAPIVGGAAAALASAAAA